MLNLIKHEFIKSRIPLIAAFLSIIITEIFYLISIPTENETMFTIATMIMMLFFSFIPVGCIIYPIYIYELDVSHKHKNGYMLFMTPNSPYKIIGAKILASFIASVAVSVLFIGLSALNASITMPSFYDDNMIEFGSIFMLFDRVSASSTAMIIIMIIAAYFQFVSTIYFIYMLVATVLERVPLKWVIGAGIFFAVSYIQNLILNLIRPSASSIDNVPADISAYEIVLTVFGGSAGFIISIILSLIIAGLTYWGTSELCRKKLSL